MSAGRIGRTLWVRIRLRGHVFGVNLNPRLHRTLWARHWTPEEADHD